MHPEATALAPRRCFTHDLFDGGRVLVQDAVTMAVDLAGFTSLTDRLSPWGSRGTEGLSRVLSTYFGGVTDLVVRAGGDPLAFGGDSLSVVFDGPPDAALRAALDSGAGIHDLTRSVEEIPTPAGPSAIQVRVGIARGPVATAVAGLRGRLLPVHVGTGLDLAHLAQETGRLGTTMVDPSAETDGADREAGHAPAPLPPVAAGGRRPEPAELLPGALLDRLQHDHAADSHREVTVAFVRYPSVTPGEMTHFLDRVTALMGLVSESGGEVVQVSGGDKGIVAMVVLGAPISHPDDPARAVHAMLELRRRDPRVAVGIATGPVFAAVLGSQNRMFPTHTGLAVNLAARLAQRGEPGVVLVDDRTWQEASSHLRRSGGPARRSLQGVAAPVTVHTVAGWRRTRSRPSSASLPPIVGRRSELDAVEQLLDGMATGRGGSLRVHGPPGIGKTRLAQEAAERARTRGFHVVVADVADHLPGRTPRLWRHVIGGLLGVASDASRATWSARLTASLPAAPDLTTAIGPVLGLVSRSPDPLLAPDAGQLAPELAQVLLGRMLRGASRPQPVLLVVENVERLDSVTERLLQGMVDATRDGRTGMVLTSGPGEDRGDPGGRVELRPLDRNQTGVLAQQAWRREGASSPPTWLTDTVASAAGGNPLLALAATRSLLARWRPGDPPPGDEVAVAPAGLGSARFDRLPVEARELLTVMATVRRPCSPRFLASLLPPGETVASVRRRAAPLVAEGLVEEAASHGEDRYRITHELARRAVYEATSHEERIRLHRLVVAQLVLEDPDPVEVSEHVAPLSDPELARHWLPLAARAERDSWNPVAALGWLERLQPLVSGRDRQLLQLQMLEALLVAGRANEVLEQAEQLRTDDGHWSVRRLHVLAEAAYSCGQLSRAEVAATEVMQLVDGTDESRYLRAGELVTLSRCDQGDLDGALQVGRALADRVAGVEDPAIRATGLAAYAVALVLSEGPDAATKPYRAALQAARQAGDTVREVHALSDLGGCAFLSGDHRTSVELLSRAREKADAIGYRRHLALSLGNEAQVRAALGDRYATACAEAAARRSLELGDLPTAADALHTWLSATPALAREPELWRRLAQVEGRVGRARDAAVAWAELAVVLSRRGDSAGAGAAAHEAESSSASPSDSVRRRTALARTLSLAPEGTGPRRRLASQRVVSGLGQLAADPELTEQEAAEIAVEHWRHSRSPQARADAVRLVRQAFAVEPSATARSWLQRLREPVPESSQPLPPPAGIARRRTTRGDLELAFTAVEAVVARAESGAGAGAGAGSGLASGSPD